MSLFIFLTILQAIVAAALVGVVLMQRSEGGGLGIGGSPGGALGARGAADFLSRSTKWLAVAFISLSIALAAVAVETTTAGSVTTTLDRETGGGAADLVGESEAAPEADPLAAPATGDTPAETAPADNADEDPLAQ
jgi:preprotein translocase subunit SecG